MSIPNWKEPRPTDHPDALAWVWKVLRPYSSQMKAISDALQGGLESINENAEIRTIDVRHGVGLEIKSTRISSRPVGVLVLACPYRCEVPVVEVLGIGKVKVTFYFTETPPPVGDVQVTLKILGG